MPETQTQHNKATATEASEDNIWPARQIALDLLEDVVTRKQALDHSLERTDAYKNLPRRDRAFVRMLVSTTLRRMGQIDDLIDKAMDRPDSLKSDRLRNILRLGITQICFMNVPDHAAVDTAVRLTETIGMEKQKGFINGVLRTITRIGQEWLTRQDEGRLNTPEWLLKTWIDDYGLGIAAQIAQAHLSEAPLDISIKDDDSRIYWSSKFQATELPTGTLRKNAGGNVTELEGFEEGVWWVQDASAAIPARLFGDIKGRTILDMCAAPGGKTAQLVDFGANVIALDRSPKRMKKMEQNLKRLQYTDKVKIIISDGAHWKPAEADKIFSHILLDAPCSATGTIRRHPDVLHLKQPQDMERLTHIQSAILQNAFDILSPGGMIVYCTCSLQKAEGEHQISQFLANNPDASRIPITKEELGGYEEPITSEGDLRILPFHNAALGGMDGFYIARITKNAAN